MSSSVGPVRYAELEEDVVRIDHAQVSVVVVQPAAPRGEVRDLRRGEAGERIARRRDVVARGRGRDLVCEAQASNVAATAEQVRLTRDMPEPQQAPDHVALRHDSCDSCGGAAVDGEDGVSRCDLRGHGDMGGRHRHGGVSVLAPARDRGPIVQHVLHESHHLAVPRAQRDLASFPDDGEASVLVALGAREGVALAWLGRTDPARRTGSTRPPETRARTSSRTSPSTGLGPPGSRPSPARSSRP